MHTEKEREDLLSAIKKMVDGTTEELPPTLLCDFNHGDMVGQTFAFNDDRDKWMLTQIIYKLIQEDKCSWFGLILESWMARASKESGMTEEELLSLPPSQRPGAQEVVMVTISNSKKQHNFFGVLEKKGGKRYISKWDTLPEEASCQGRFTDLWRKAKAITN
jgi:hypothetical protein